MYARPAASASQPISAFEAPQPSAPSGVPPHAPETSALASRPCTSVHSSEMAISGRGWPTATQNA